jgi:hypothetical protein
VRLRLDSATLARPGVALERQSPDDLMWIRQVFLDSTVGFERVVVHGHTPAQAVHADRRRIGIDTKAYDTGVLTGLRMEGQERSLLQASGAPDESYLAVEALCKLLLLAQQRLPPHMVLHQVIAAFNVGGGGGGIHASAEEKSLKPRESATKVDSRQAGGGGEIVCRLNE